MLELSYHWAGDYLIPDLDAPEAPRIGKYGTIRHNYLRDHHRGVFDAMLLKGTLQEKGVKLTLRAIAEEAELSHTTLLQPAIKLELYKAFPIGEKINQSGNRKAPEPDYRVGRKSCEIQKSECRFEK